MSKLFDPKMDTDTAMRIAEALERSDRIEANRQAREINADVQRDNGMVNSQPARKG